MRDAVSEFIDHMRSCGCGPGDGVQIVDDDAIHRYHVEGDKAGRRNGSYRLRVEPDGFAFGWCLSFKEGMAHKWHSRTDRTATPEERADRKRRAEEARVAAKKARDEAAASAAASAQRIWDRATAGAKTPYTERKGILPHGARVWRDMLVVPVRMGRYMTSLQFIGSDGDKRFLKGGRIDGAYCSLAGRDDDLSHIVIAEGFATAATIRQALGVPVIAAFNAGNLAPVAKSIRSRYPDARITIAADNDQWTTRQDGTPWNPGIDCANAAAVGIGGARVLAPNFPLDDPARRTDWNDAGEDAVKEAFARAEAPDIDDAPDDASGDEAEYNSRYEILEDTAIAVPPPPPPAPERIDPLDEINPLGHNDGVFYFYPVASGQIVGIPATGLSSMQNLYRLAPRSFWDNHYNMDGKQTNKTICDLASAHLIAACQSKSVYYPEATRGVGVWMDRGKVVVNTGDEILQDGISYIPARFSGEYTYESGPRVMNIKWPPLDNLESNELRQICRSLSWRLPMYADLLAGFLVIAPVGGSIPWRPHIWLTGQSGSGKSTVMDKIVSRVLGSMAIMREGGTTEAAVRKAIGRSSRPYVLDEAESEGMRARVNMQAILTIARISSSGGVIENANDQFRAQSCFCFSSINPGIEQLADENRITVLKLDQDVDADSRVRYERLLAHLNSTLTPEFSARLLARTLTNMDALIANIATFAQAAQAALGSARSGEQIGALLAGAFLLTSTRTISLKQAKSWIDGQEWSWHDAGEMTDSYRCLAHIMQSRIVYDIDGVRRESMTGDLVTKACGSSLDVGHAQATAALRGCGIIVRDGRLIVSNTSSTIKRWLSDTPWVNWRSTLERYPGADNAGGGVHYFVTGLKSRAVSIPMSSILAPSGRDEDQLEFRSEDFL